MESYAVEPISTLLAEVDPAGRLAVCGLRRLVLGPGAIATVADTVATLLRETDDIGDSRHQVVLLVDRTRIGRLGADVKDLVEHQLQERYDVHRIVLDDGHPKLHVVEGVLAVAARAVSAADAVVALGGGTISDIGKVAVQRARARGRRRPILVTVQTAASVDGYTDDVSVVLRDGVKRTVQTCWPDGVVADAETIAEAPPAMNRAGFGEMTSMLVAPADWRLAALVGVDETFHAGPIRLLRVVGDGLDDWSAGVRDGEPSAIGALTRALALRGIATGVAGTTAVLSGVEHLVSHLLDQHHTLRHLPMGLHGAQVGVASVVAAAAWELLFERLGSGAGVTRLIDDAFDLTAARVRVDAAFGPADPTGQVVEECWRDYSAKLRAVEDRQGRVSDLLASWPAPEPELRTLVRPSADIAAGLRAAGAAATFGELDPQVDDALARWALANSALMRNRFTVVDLLTLVGWWRDPDVDEVLDRARRAVAAAEERVG